MGLIRRRRRLRSLRKHLARTTADYNRRLRHAERTGVEGEDLRSLEAEAAFEEDQIKEEIDALVTNELLAQANRLGVPVPGPNDQEAWVEARYTGVRHNLLTTRGVHLLRDSVREEQRKRRETSLPWVAAATGLASAVAACLAVWLSGSQGSEIADLTRMQRALAHAPKWEIKTAAYEVQTQADSIRAIADTVEVAVKTKVRVEITLMNVGNTPGRFLGTVSKDVPSGEDDIRRSLLGITVGPFAARPTTDFWTYREVAVGDTFIISSSFTLRRREHGWGTLHMLMLYENPAGDLYDTYYWTKYTSRHDVVDLTREDPKRAFEDLFQIDSKNQSWWIYSEEERGTVLETVRDVVGH